MTCEDINEILSAFVDGEETPQESVAVRAHLEGCEGCRSIVDDYRRIEAVVPVREDAPALRPRDLPRRRVLRPSRALLAAAMLTVAAGGSVLAGIVTTDGGERALVPVPTVDVGASPPATASDDPSDPADPSSPRPSPTATPTERPSPSPLPPKDQPGAARGSDGQLALMLMVERTVAAPGDEIRTGVVLRNVTKDDITFRSPRASAMDVVITDGEGTIVYRRSQAEGWEREMVTRTLAPGEQLAERLAFVAPRPGKYLIYAECVCMPDGVGTHPSARPAASPSDPPSKVGPFRTNDIGFASVPAR